MSEDQPEAPPDSQLMAGVSNSGYNDDMNLFASVWVKVEVLDEDHEENQDVMTPREPKYEVTEEPPTEPVIYPSFTPTMIIKKERVIKKRIRKHMNLKCSECDHLSSSKQSLKAHMICHSTVKPYTCTHCDYSTKYPLSLKRHIFVQHECKESPTAKNTLPTFKCTMCKYTTNFKWNLSSHLRKHELAKQYPCSYCNYSTAYKHNFEKHSRKHMSESESNYKCDKCPFTSKFEGHIVRHLAKIHFEISEKASRCEYCSFSTRTKWRLNKHVNRSREETPLFCPICDYQTSYRCALREHKFSHTDPGPVDQRWLDNLLTPKQNTDIQDVELKLPKDQPQEATETCEIQSKKETAVGNISETCQFQSKEEAVAGNISETCLFQSKEETVAVNISETCQFQSKEETVAGNISDTSKDLEDLKEKLLNDSYYTYNDSPPDIEVNFTQETDHERNNHYRLDPTCEIEWSSIRVIESPDLDRPFQCITCSYKAKFKASVQRHYQRHHTSQNRPYKCIKCDFSTKTKDQIFLHNKRSISNLLLSCRLCSFTTLFKCQYTMHEKAHMAFKCIYCDYAARKKQDIYKHFTVVHIENGLKCSYCDFKAVRKESLLVHQSIHTGKKPFQCKHCSYTSVRRHLLENHIIRLHSNQKQETVLEEARIESLRKPLVENLEANLNCSGDYYSTPQGTSL